MDRVFVNRFQTAGRHTLQWESRNTGGRALSSGVYVLRLEVGGEVATRKIVVQR